MKNLNFDDIPASDAETLKNELGRWLTEAGDRWCDNKNNGSLINYDF